MAEQSQNTEIFSKEIAELEAKLAAKKQELIRAGIESPEKTVFKEVLREHVTIGEAPTPNTAAATTTSTNSNPPRSATKEEEERANLLIAHAFTKGLKNAIAEAKKMDNAFFLDLLHDRLADEYYQKLLAAKKIKQIS